MKAKWIILLLSIFSLTCANAWERVPVWPKGKMPNSQEHQIAAMTDEVKEKGFKADKHRVAYLEWGDKPAKEVDNDGCMILLSGGSYQNCCDVGLI